MGRNSRAWWGWVPSPARPIRAPQASLGYPASRCWATASITGPGTRRVKCLLPAVEPRAEVAVAAVREDHDENALRGAGCVLPGGIERGSRRIARHDAFGAGQVVGQLPGRLGGDADLLVGQAGVVNAGHDRASHVLEALQAMQGIVGLGGDQPDVAVVLFEGAAGPHPGAAGAHARHALRESA